MSATVLLHPSMTAAQAEQVCSENNLKLCQDGRGNLSIGEKVSGWRILGDTWIGKPDREREIT